MVLWFCLSGPKKSPLTTPLIHHPVVVDGGGDLYRLVYGDEHLLIYTKDSYRDLQGLVMPSYLPCLPSYLLLVSLYFFSILVLTPCSIRQRVIPFQ